MFHGINFEKPNCLGWTIVYPCLRFGMCCEITTELNKFLRWTIIYPRAWYVCFVEFTLKIQIVKGVLHPLALFLKTLCIFSKNKATSDKVSHRSGQKCSKELKNHSFTLVKTIVVKLQ